MNTLQTEHIVLNSELGDIVLSQKLKQEIKELVTPYIASIEQVAQGLTVGIGEKSLLDVVVNDYQPKNQ